MSELHYKIYTKIAQIPQEWDDIDDNLFLNNAYLRAQEIATPPNIDYYYIAVYDQQKLVGKSVVQRIRMSGKEFYRNSDNRLRDDLINLLNLNMLCIGNIKVTGEHAYAFTPNIILDSGIHQIQQAIKQIRKTSKREDLPIKLILFKDFYTKSADHSAHLFEGYEKLSVQPNMVFKVRKDWNDFDDYLAALRAKYRTRTKRAFKHGQKLNFIPFDIHQIQQYNTAIYRLYHNVLDNNKFSVYQLPENYFLTMKQEMQERFKFFAGFLDEKMVCFYTILENNQQIEAGFLGYDIELQKKNQLYLNMLYQMIGYAIRQGFHQIDFSRTALEIKSSVGAEPQPMYGFLRHTHPLMNKILRSTFKKFYQTDDWVERNPFKN